jgi:hypothetical protein
MSQQIAAVKTTGEIAGFNRQWTSIMSIRAVIGNERRTIGYVFECACGTIKRFSLAHFYDPYGAAVRAMESHRCSIS